MYDLTPAEIRALFWDTAKTPTRSESEHIAALIAIMQEDED